MVASRMKGVSDPIVPVTKTAVPAVNVTARSSSSSLPLSASSIGWSASLSGSL